MTGSSPANGTKLQLSGSTRMYSSVEAFREGGDHLRRIQGKQACQAATKFPFFHYPIDV